MTGPALILDALLPHLGPDDDQALWIQALADVYADSRREVEAWTGKDVLRLAVGACSHWLRPHQTRWSTNGGFAWPAGYGDALGGSRGAPPQHDWTVVAHWDSPSSRWTMGNAHSRRPLTLRVTLPTRTARHEQAVVHLCWRPGSPAHPRRHRTTFFGYRKREGIWSLEATQDIAHGA